MGNVFTANVKSIDAYVGGTHRRVGINYPLY